MSDRMIGLKLSQRALAERAGLSKSAVTRLLSGERNPQTKTLEKLALALALPLAVLVDPPPSGGPEVPGVLHLVDTETPPGPHDSGTSTQYAGDRAPVERGGGQYAPAGSGQGGGVGASLGAATPYFTYRGYVTGEREDPRDPATWAGALSDSRRRTLMVGDHTKAIGTEEAGFAVLVQDNSLSHATTEDGPVVAGMTLYVDTAHPELMHAPRRLVVAVSRAGELVAGFLERDAAADDDGWLIVDARIRHPVAPDGLRGAVVRAGKPLLTRIW